MNEKHKNMPINLIVTAVLLLLLVILFASTQTTLGRYMSSFGGELGFAFNSKQSVSLTHGEWSGKTGQKSLPINLNGDGDGANRLVRIRLYLPQSVDISSVVIKIDSAEYTADISSVPEGTAVYNSYGEGSVCRFYEAYGKELTLSIPDSGEESLDATLTFVSDADFDTEGIKIIAEPINLKGKGGN